ncbi:TPA: hypothetical protein ACH3X2_001873 [Trebouxia sp. C0005]
MDQANGLGEPVQLRQRCFSEAGPDGVVHFQIVDLRRQLFVWVSAGSTELGNLSMATQTRMDNVPAVASLNHSSSNDAANTLAQKLGDTGQDIQCIKVYHKSVQVMMGHLFVVGVC